MSSTYALYLKENVREKNFDYLCKWREGSRD